MQVDAGGEVGGVYADALQVVVDGVSVGSVKVDSFDVGVAGSEQLSLRSGSGAGGVEHGQGVYAVTYVLGEGVEVAGVVKADLTYGLAVAVGDAVEIGQGGGVVCPFYGEHAHVFIVTGHGEEVAFAVESDTTVARYGVFERCTGVVLDVAIVVDVEE